jgi:hypothetical protein
VTGDPSEILAVNAEASTLMKRGIDILTGTRPDRAARALDCFDRALELRRRLPVNDVAVRRYDLAACWLNRGEALLELGEETRNRAALLAFEEAITLLRTLPSGEDFRFPRRLAIAHHNRGLALLGLGHAFSDLAITAFSDAISVLDHQQSAGIPDRQHLLAAAWMNLARARAADPLDRSRRNVSLARTAAERAIAMVKDLEAGAADAAEVGLKARHLLCQILARSLSTKPEDDRTIPDDVHEASDVADEGLVLARHWEQRGVDRFRAIACDLFRFGGRVYARYQPQFLQEFVRDNMDPQRSSPAYVSCAEMRAAAEQFLEPLTREPTTVRIVWSTAGG